VNEASLQPPDQKTPSDLPWRKNGNGIDLGVRLTPRGGRAGFDGVIIVDGSPCLKIRVSAPPVDGAANKALIALLARSLRMPKSCIRFISGERARIKRLHLEGDGLTDRLAALIKT
jgi:uncharacterized protein YggU (UPF0235/DUF167 family)